jgi:GntR family transcriptional regulator
MRTYDAPRIQHSPLYSQLVKIFQENIQRKEWKLGVALPSEGELSRQFGVSVGTARKALEVLEQAGWITRRQGRGTFVSDPMTRHAGGLSRVLISGQGEVSECCELSLLKQETRSPNQEESDFLKSPPGARIIHVRRLFSNKSSGVMIEDIILRSSEEGVVLDPKLAASPNAFASMLAGRLSGGSQCVEQFSAVTAPEHVAQALKIESGTPVLRCRRVMEDEAGVPLAVSDRWIVTEGPQSAMVLG